jgi:hypothetical protein
MMEVLVALIVLAFVAIPLPQYAGGAPGVGPVTLVCRHRL